MSLLQLFDFGKSKIDLSNVTAGQLTISEKLGIDDALRIFENTQKGYSDADFWKDYKLMLTGLKDNLDVTYQNWISPVPKDGTLWPPFYNKEHWSLVPRTTRIKLAEKYIVQLKNDFLRKFDTRYPKEYRDSVMQVAQAKLAKGEKDF